MKRVSRKPWARRAGAAATIIAVLFGAAGADFGTVALAQGVDTKVFSVRGPDGQEYHVTNHITGEIRRELNRGRPHEWLLVWAGDASANQPDPTTSNPDFLAVVDVTKGSPTYGHVANTVTLGPLTGNEPHHLQYQWHKGDTVFAGGLLSDVTYAFDVSALPEVRLRGVVPSTATPCGSLPDAYHMLSDGTAYATYLGGPDVSGACRYSDGQTRVGNGFGGSPGEVVRLSATGEVLSEAPAASATSEGPTCGNIPALATPTCANPHGIAVREDLNRMVTSDFSEARNLIGGVMPSGPPIIRDTVRVYDIKDRNHPKVISVSHLSPGPRPVPDPILGEGYGVMETTLTNAPQHRGAFAATLNGAVYYTPDITMPDPQWREVYDDQTAFKALIPTDTPTSAIDGGSWLQVSPDDRYLYHLVLGGGYGSPGDTNTGMLYALDIRKLLASGHRVKCHVDTEAETFSGGAESDCPTLAGTVGIHDETYGGPHWATMDNFRLGPDGRYRETKQTQRIATSEYFIAATGTDGNHKVCMFDVGAAGQLTVDRDFRDENSDTPCLSFNRPAWPHGTTGDARPHGLLFVVGAKDLR
ncbi:hypothetical protein [Micromonospora sp. NPDC003776]